MTGRLPSLPVTADERRSLARIRRDIDRRGWAAAEGCVVLDDEHVATDYSVGFTRHHGHPEVIVVGRSMEEGRRLLSRLAHEIALGTRFEPCLVQIDGAGYGLLEVDDPQHLWLAHLLYGREGLPVRALQLVPEDGRGLLPWEGGGGTDRLLGPWPF